MWSLVRQLQLPQVCKENLKQLKINICLNFVNYYLQKTRQCLLKSSSSSPPPFGWWARCLSEDSPCSSCLSEDSPCSSCLSEDSPCSSCCSQQLMSVNNPRTVPVYSQAVSVHQQWTVCNEQLNCSVADSFHQIAKLFRRWQLPSDS